MQPTFMGTGQKQAAVEQLAVLKAQLAELELRVVAAVSDEEIQQSGHRDAAGWLAKATRIDRGDALGMVRLAGAVDRRWNQLAAGMAEGTVNPRRQW